MVRGRRVSGDLADQRRLRQNTILAQNGIFCSDMEYRTWMCVVCGFVYDEAAGLPAEGIAPGTRWEDVPPNWTCPECGTRKEDFEMVRI